MWSLRISDLHASIYHFNGAIYIFLMTSFVDGAVFKCVTKYFLKESTNLFVILWNLLSNKWLLRTLKNEKCVSANE